MTTHERLSRALSKLSSGGPLRLEKAERKALVAIEPALFPTIYLRDDDGNEIFPGEIHLQWWDVFKQLRQGTIKSACIMAPKGHAKSTIWNKAVPLYLICEDPNVRGISASVNEELAERFMRAVRTELERNQLLIEDYGPFKPLIPEKWTQAEIIVNRTSTSASPTWRTAATGGQVQGGRSDWVIGDDIASVENSSTMLQRDKVDRWLREDVLGTLEPETGRTMVVGTAKNNDDVYHRIEKQRAQGGRVWYFLRQDAIVEEQRHLTLWPERWSWAALMERKAQIGTLAFDRDMRNRAVSEETSLFPHHILEPAKRTDLVLEQSYGTKSGETDAVVAGIDYGIVEDERQAQQADTDWSVCQVWRLLPEKRRRLLWMLRYRGKGFTEQAALITACLARYPTLKIAVSEQNQAQRWMKSEILRKALSALPIVGHTTTRAAHVDLYEGVPSLATLFENGLIELPYGDEYSRQMTDVFVGELFGLGVEAHDDTVMACYLADVGARRITSGLSWGVLKQRK